MANSATRPRPLTRSQIEQVVRFDMAKRMGGDYDGRRHGSVTGKNAPSYMEAWTWCHGHAPGPGEKPCRKTLRYHLIVPRRAAKGKRPEVDIAHVAVRLNRAYAPVVKMVAYFRMDSDVILYRDMGYHQVAGWIVYWDRADWDNKAVRSWMSPRFEGEWEAETYRPRGALTFPWHECVNPDALKGTRYEWCQWDGTSGLVDWLKLYRAEPRIELVAKLGLRRLCTPAGAKALQDPKVRDYLRSHLDELKRTRTVWGVKEFVWSARRGVHVREGARHFDLVHQMRYYKSNIKSIRLDYERIRKMLPKWQATPAEYARYLSLCETLDMDMRCEGVLYPPVGHGDTDFHARLERLEEDAERRARAAERARLRRDRLERDRSKKLEAELLAERIPEIERFQAAVDRSAVLDLGQGVRCILAKDQETLLKEGKRMHNCVGMGHYGRGILAGTTLILMFYKDGKPFVDAEIERATWHVRQCYAKGNTAAPAGYLEAAQRVAALLKRECSKKRRSA